MNFWYDTHFELTFLLNDAKSSVLKNGDDSGTVYFLPSVYLWNEILSPIFSIPNPSLWFCLHSPK